MLWFYIFNLNEDIRTTYLAIYAYMKYNIILASYNAKMLHTECGSVKSFTTFGKLMRSGLESYNNAY